MTRYTDIDLARMLQDLESDLVERKENFKAESSKKVAQAICAFANDFPNHNRAGVLFIGAKDNGTPSGLAITDELLLNLAALRSDGNILPMPAMTVEKRTVGGAEMAVVCVQPSDAPPVKYEGRVWIRTGPRRSTANAQEERILSEKRRYKNLPFDLYPVPTATVADLSRPLFENTYLPAAFAPDVLEENHRSYEEKLASCKFIVSPDNLTPTLTGLLAVGHSPQDLLPGAYIQFLRIAGAELADPVVDEAIFAGAIGDMLRGTDEKLRSHNRTIWDVESASTHTSRELYPIAALRQILYNAVLHRTYEGTHAPIRIYWFQDRIEIYSPGGPYGNVTADNFGSPGVTDYRNPNIGVVLKNLGYIQSFGRGIAIARREMERNGNPTPEFKVDASAVAVTFKISV